MIDALKDKYRIVILLEMLQMAKSSYFYHVQAMKHADKYADLRTIVRKIFDEAAQTYGYRRIYASLLNKGIRISEKVIRRIMSEEGIIVEKAKKKKIQLIPRRN